LLCLIGNDRKLQVKITMKTFNYTIFCRFYAFFMLISLVLAAFATSSAVMAQDIWPESPTGYLAQKAVQGQDFMIVTAHPKATQAGYDVLARGGSAADAAIAAQLVLGLVEPQSSGLGGGGFVLYYDAQKGTLSALDGREVAPATVGRHLFRSPNGEPMRFYDAAVGGRAVGVPGLPLLLEQLHRWHGKRPWKELATPAIALAQNGFEVSPRLAQMIIQDRERLQKNTEGFIYFYPDTISPLSVGRLRDNPKYADFLKQYADQGAKAFYQGKTAEEIVRTVREFRENPGALTLEDLQNYSVKERQPVCQPYREYNICTLGEPSGGLSVLITLGILQHFDLSQTGANTPQSWHLIGEASRLAFADRNYYMSDPDFADQPRPALLDPDYLKKRASLISADKVNPKIEHGTPSNVQDLDKTPDQTQKNSGTTHISVIDSYGNALSLTSSIENAFGSRLMAQGMFLNNQLTDFAFKAEEDGKSVANAVEGGKRPRSDMAPVIVFDGNFKPVLILGSAGGSAIPGYVVQMLVSVLDWDMEIDAALGQSHIIHRGEVFEIEQHSKTKPALVEGLKALGHPVEKDHLNSGLHVIRVEQNIIKGAADPRREGAAMGR
jgi:gamma-glutamyltranspeptidase/glutathione hydrolase